MNTCKDCKYRAHGAAYDWDTCNLMSNRMGVGVRSELVVIDVEKYNEPESETIMGSNLDSAYKPFMIDFRTHESWFCKEWTK